MQVKLSGKTQILLIVGAFIGVMAIVLMQTPFVDSVRSAFAQTGPCIPEGSIDDSCDQDKDGVLDQDDQCVLVPGPAANNGCPYTATTPPPTTPPATQPPATQPPATQPPATQPPATQPPATQPPATQPPATQPPATQPPATLPPATPPPTTPPPATTVTPGGSRDVLQTFNRLTGGQLGSALSGIRNVVNNVFTRVRSTPTLAVTVAPAPTTATIRTPIPSTSRIVLTQTPRPPLPPALGFDAVARNVTFNPSGGAYNNGTVSINDESRAEALCLEAGLPASQCQNVSVFVPNGGYGVNSEYSGSAFMRPSAVNATTYGPDDYTPNALPILERFGSLAPGNINFNLNLPEFPDDTPSISRIERPNAFVGFDGPPSLVGDRYRDYVIEDMLYVSGPVPTEYLPSDFTPGTNYTFPVQRPVTYTGGYWTDAETTFDPEVVPLTFNQLGPANTVLLEETIQGPVNNVRSPTFYTPARVTVDDNGDLVYDYWNELDDVIYNVGRVNFGAITYLNNTTGYVGDAGDAEDRFEALINAPSNVAATLLIRQGQGYLAGIVGDHGVTDGIVEVQPQVFVITDENGTMPDERVRVVIVVEQSGTVNASQTIVDSVETLFASQSVAYTTTAYVGGDTLYFAEGQSDGCLFQGIYEITQSGAQNRVDYNDYVNTVRWENPACPE